MPRIDEVGYEINNEELKNNQYATPKNSKKQSIPQRPVEFQSSDEESGRQSLSDENIRVRRSNPMESTLHEWRASQAKN